MKRYFLLLVALACTSVSHGQLIKQGDQAPKKQSELDWYNCSVSDDGVYGAEVNKAYEFLKDKKLKKRPVVALIGTGIDVEHEDLKQAIWTNPKEKANGKDTDKNGLIDDINGWNYLGGPDGQVMEKLTTVGDREFLRLKDKYADYITGNGKYFKIIDGKVTEVPAPRNLEEYTYYKSHVFPASALAQAYGSLQISYVIREYGMQLKKDLEAKLPGKTLTKEDFFTHCALSPREDSLKYVAFAVIAVGFQLPGAGDFESVHSHLMQHIVAESQKGYETALQRYGSDSRQEIVGDNCLDINDTRYGNNVLLTTDAAVGTMQAGIIGAGRGNTLGGDGIMDQARIMTLRVSTGSGEPYLKDLALAIRYAVDHAADIIVLPQQGTLYPDLQKQWVNDALTYAEKKGVLVIVPVWERSQDMTTTTYYPNRRVDGTRELTNLMLVGASDKKGNPSMRSNYSASELDLFAPGIEIYSTYTGDTYQTATSVALATASVAGVAALIKAYYPHLTGTQIRAILLDNVTSREGVEVEKGIFIDGNETQDLFLFEDLCLTGGILNAYQSVVAADKLAK